MKKIFITILSICLSNALIAQPGIQKSSGKSKGSFKTTVSLDIDTTQEEALAIVDKFIDQYNNNITPLFGWALTGIKLQGEKDDFIEFNIKSHSYNESNKTVEGLMKINLSFLGKNFENIKYKTRLKKEIKPDNSVILHYEMPECEEVINHVSAKLTIKQKNTNKLSVNFAVDLKLKMPYNLMTAAQYKDNLEWRFVRFLQNIKKEAEK